MKKKFSLFLITILLFCNMGTVFAEEVMWLNKKYDCVFPFHGGLATVSINKGEDIKYGLINFKGKEILPLKYDFISDFSDGLVSVCLDKKWGFVDKKGKEIIPCKYDFAYDFREGLAFVELNNRWGAINKKDEIVIPFKYEDANCFYGGLCVVMLNNKYGCIDKKGNTIIPFKYDIISISEDGKYIILGVSEGDDYIEDIPTYCVDSYSDYATISGNYKIGIIKNPISKNKVPN